MKRQFWYTMQMLTKYWHRKRVLLVKRIVKVFIFFITMMIMKSSHCKVLMKLNVCLFWWKITFFKKTINKIWAKISNSIKKWFHSELTYKGKYLKNKSKSDEGKIKIYFHDNEIPKEGSLCISMSVILIDSVFKKSQNCHLHVVLEELIDHFHFLN